MDLNKMRLFLFFLRMLQCSGSLIVIIIEILRRTNIINSIESTKVNTNEYELFFEYCVMNLGFVISALYLFRFNQRWKEGPYNYDIFIDCVLMNAWMIFGILRLSPEFESDDVLACNQYEDELRKGCIVYISSVALGYSISGSYFLTAILSTWLWSEKGNLQTNSNSNSNSNSNHNPNHNRNSNFNSDTNSDSNTNSNFNFYFNSYVNSNPINNNSLSPLDQTKLAERNNFRNNNDLPQIVTIKHDDIEFNRTEGTIIIFRKPSPSFLKYEHSSSNSSLYENNSCISEYSLGSSFSRTYGSIIIPRKNSIQNEYDTSTNNSRQSKLDDSTLIGRGQSISTYSEHSINSKHLSSSLSDQTSRSSKYDGSIIIKLVT